MSTELATRPADEQMLQAGDAARVCKQIVTATALSIRGRRYVKVEGWQAIAVAHGAVASSGDVESVAGGFRAVAELRRMSDGAVLCRAEGFVGDDEPMWAQRPLYARRAMAQTRAISRVCRSAFAHVVVMMQAGLETTPAEEIPIDEVQHTEVVEPDASSAPDKGLLIAEIRKRSKDVPAGDKAEAAETYLGGAKRLEDADVAQLSDLLGWLKARQAHRDLSK